MIDFKHSKDIKMFASLHPALIMIFADMYTYALEKHGIKLTVTQTVSNSFIDKQLKRKSPAHSEKRAIDIRSRGVDSFILADILDFVNNKIDYQKYKYVSLSGERRLAYWHNNGNGEHIHLAIHSRYKD